MKIETVNLIKSFLNDLGEIDLSSNISIENEIIEGEKILNVVFDEDYKYFIKHFGGCYIGVSIYGFKNSKMLENISVIELTQKFRLQKTPEATESYVISFDGSGNPIMINKEGKIIMYDHDNGIVVILAENFEEWIINLLS